MQFDSISSFFAMGGYGFFVWLSYGSAALLLGLIIVSSKLSHKKTKQQIANRFKREEKLKRAAKQRKEAL